MALLTVRRSDLIQRSRSGDLRATKILQFRANPERALSILQFGIAFSAAVSAAVGASGAVERLAPKLIAEYGFHAGTAHALVVALAVIPLTLLNVVVGELVTASA